MYNNWGFYWRNASWSLPSILHVQTTLRDHKSWNRDRHTELKQVKNHQWSFKHTLFWEYLAMQSHLGLVLAHTSFTQYSTYTFTPTPHLGVPCYQKLTHGFSFATAPYRVGATAGILGNPIQTGAVSLVCKRYTISHIYSVYYKI